MKTDDSDCLIKKSALLNMLDVGKSWLYLKLDANSKYYDETFPKPFKISGGRVNYWRKSDCEKWINNQINKAKGCQS